MDKDPKKTPDGRWSSAMRWYAVSAIAVLGGIALSVALFVVVRSWERGRMQANFERAAANRVSAVVGEIQSQLLITESIGSLFLASPETARLDFQAFVTPLLEHYPNCLFT